MRRCVILLLICFIFLPASRAHAWSYKEHIQFARLAAMRLLEADDTPPEMKAFLRKAFTDLKPDLAAEKDFFLNTPVGDNPKGLTGLSLWVATPDMRATGDPRSSRVEPFGVHERLLHYVDLELLMTGPQRRGYRHDLSGIPKITDVPRDMNFEPYKQAGMLPFRVEDCYKHLVRCIREGKLDESTATTQDDHAVRWAGFLAHYVQDNTQPHHATVDYKSQTYFADRRRAPNIHSEMEWKMADDAKNPHRELREEYWPLFEAALTTVKDPAESTRDPWQATLEISYYSYEALPLIGLAAMHAAGQKGTPENPEGPANDQVDTEAFFRFKGPLRNAEATVMEMKAHQTALAVLRTQRMWLQAWAEAHE